MYNISVFQLSFIDYHMYIKLASVIIRLKLVLTFYDIKTQNSTDTFFNLKSESHLARTFKTKLDDLKSNYNENEVQVINALFVSKQMP